MTRVIMTSDVYGTEEFTYLNQAAAEEGLKRLKEEAAALNDGVEREFRVTDDTHEIMVSNIGCVYHGDDETQAAEYWNKYVVLTREKTGRAAGETVTWLDNGQIRCESDGSRYQSR